MLIDIRSPDPGMKTTKKVRQLILIAETDAEASELYEVAIQIGGEPWATPEPVTPTPEER